MHNQPVGRRQKMGGSTGHPLERRMKKEISVQNNNSQQTAHFKKIDDISRVNAHQTSALAEDIAVRSNWSPSFDLSDDEF